MPGSAFEGGAVLRPSIPTTPGRLRHNWARSSHRGPRKNRFRPTSRPRGGREIYRFHTPSLVRGPGEGGLQGIGLVVHSACRCSFNGFVAGCYSKAANGNTENTPHPLNFHNHGALQFCRRYVKKVHPSTHQKSGGPTTPPAMPAPASPSGRISTGR